MASSKTKTFLVYSSGHMYGNWKKRNFHPICLNSRQWKCFVDFFFVIPFLMFWGQNYHFHWNGIHSSTLNGNVCVFLSFHSWNCLKKKRLPQDFSVVTRLYLLSLGSVHCPLNTEHSISKSFLQFTYKHFILLLLFMFTFGFWNHYINCPMPNSLLLFPFDSDIFSLLFFYLW